MAIIKSNKDFRTISRQRLNTSSRLNAYNVLQVSDTNQFFLNHFRNFTIPDFMKNDNGYFTVYYADDSEWWDNISDRFYDTPYYWYVLCEFNDIINPYEELVAGQLIKILRGSYMYSIFKSLEGISSL